MLTFARQGASMPSSTRMHTYAHVCSRMLVKVVPRRVALENGAMPAGEAAAKQHLQELSKEEEAAIVNAEAAVVGGLVKHVIPRVDDSASREDLLMLLDNLVGAASAAGAPQFTCFTSTKVQMLCEDRLMLLHNLVGAASTAGTQFTCFTSTKSTSADT